MINNFKLMQKVLIVTSLILMVSVLIGNPRVMGIAFLVWILNVFWNLKLSNPRFGLSDLERSIDKEIDMARLEKKYFKKGLYYITLSLMGIGMLMLVIIIIILITR